MITIYALKPRFQKALQPFLRILANAGITPNQVTIFTAVFSICFGVYFCWASKSSWWLMPIILLIRMALNAIDGMMARQLHMESRIGVYLNEMGDLISDLFLYLPFALAYPWLMGPAIFLIFFTEISGMLGLAIGTERRFDGPMGKSDRAFYFGCAGFLISMGWINHFWSAVVLSAMMPLLCWTIFLRIKNALSGGP